MKNKIKTKLLFIAFIAIISPLVMAQEVSFTNRSDLLGSFGQQGQEDCAVDMNGDYLDDIVRIGNNLIVIDYQQTDGTFSQRSFPMNLQNNPGWSICAGDIDNNGYNDLLFGGGQAVSFLYANDDGSAYTEDYKSDYIFSQRTTFSDIDNDGNLDAFVCHDIDQSHPFRNDGTGALTLDKTLIETANLAGNYAALWVDYDNDGHTDLYITKCRQGSTSGDIERTNLLYKNNGIGGYIEVGAATNMDDNAQSWATVFEDFDNDGDFDAFIVNHDFENRFKLNNGGIFEDIIESTGIDPTDLGAWENAAADFNNDGYVDILSELTKELYLNNGDLTFTGYDLPFDDGGLGDFNNDGFIDVVKNNAIWMNDGNDNNWVKVNTEGIISNRNGIGTRVEIYGSWGIQIREVRAGQSFSPMSSMAIHFGIGQAESIDSLVLRWPSGVVTVIENPEINKTHDVPEVSCLLDASTLTVTGATEICAGETVTIEAPAGFDTYNWSNDMDGQSITVTDEGTYSVQLSNEDGCLSLSNKVVVRYIVDEMPGIELVGDESFCEGASTILATNSDANPVWSNGMMGQTIEVTEAGEYTVATDAICSDDQLMSEAISVDVLASPLPVVEDVTITEESMVMLTATGNNLQWYDSEVGGTLLGSGNNFETPLLNSTTDYYVEAHNLHGGGEENGGKLTPEGGGGLPGTGAYSYFDTYEPFTIREVTVIVPEDAPEGIRNIALVDELENIIASREFDLTHGEHVLPLNFDVPVGNNFSLRCPENNLFRNNEGVNYPYPIGTVGTITTSFYGGQYYYYFYDWKIQKPLTECVTDRVLAQVIFSAVNNLENIEDLNVFPNPADDQLFVSYRAIDRSPMMIRLFDATGKELYRKDIDDVQLGDNMHEIDVQNLAKGLYNIHITANGKIASQKVIVQ